MSENETVLQHCRRTTLSFIGHKCDRSCRFHAIVSTHICDATCSKVICYLSEAKIKLLGPESAYPKYSTAEIRTHCETMSDEHRCTSLCNFFYAVKKHRCKKKGSSKCPTECSIRLRQKQSQPPRKPKRKPREEEEDDGEDYGYLEELDEEQERDAHHFGHGHEF